jgi:hypothetical protein
VSTISIAGVMSMRILTQDFPLSLTLDSSICGSTADNHDISELENGSVKADKKDDRNIREKGFEAIANMAKISSSMCVETKKANKE